MSGFAGQLHASFPKLGQTTSNELKRNYSRVSAAHAAGPAVLTAKSSSSMAFNHYAKMKRILDLQPDGWVIRRVDEPTRAKNFKGEVVDFSHYYRIYDGNGQPIKYCKFQQIERLARVLEVSVESLPIID